MNDSDLFNEIINKIKNENNITSISSIDEHSSTSEILIEILSLVQGLSDEPRHTIFLDYLPEIYVTEEMDLVYFIHVHCF